MRAILCCALGLLLCGGLSADDKKDEKIDAKKLVGKWQEKGAPKGEGLMELTKDGKYRMTIGKGDVIEGTYKVEGNKIKYVVSLNGKNVEDVMTVSKLTDTELVVYAFEGAKKQETYIRVK